MEPIVSLYHGTNSSYLCGQISSGYYRPSGVWVGLAINVPYDKALQSAAQYHSYPVIVHIRPSSGRGITLESREDHLVLSGIVPVTDLEFLNRFGRDGLEGIIEIAKESGLTFESTGKRDVYCLVASSEKSPIIRPTRKQMRRYAYANT